MTSATKRRPASGLGSFLEALEARLGELTAEQIEAALLAHAEQLPPREREAFLAIFADTERDRAHASVVEQGSEDDPLIVEIDAFVERLRAGSYVLGWGWDSEIHDERAFGDESWVEKMDDLFAAAAAAFLAGETEFAREALGRLLRSFALEEETQAFCGPDTPERMVSTDIGEAKARYLRAVYETTSASDRPGALLDAIHDLGYVGGDASLGALEEARRAPLPELDTFLPAWIACLRSVGDHAQRSSPLDRKLAWLLSEAAEWHGGADGLGELARSRGALDPDAHRDWVDPLVRGGRHRDAADAAREALGRLEPRSQARAVIAERLARLAARAGDDDGALEARRERWRVGPSTRRLLALIDIATALGRAEEVLAQEAEWALAAREHPGADGRNVAGDRLACELLLLAGRVDQAEGVASLTPLGWDHRHHPAPVVIPYLLVAATGPAIRPELLIAAGPLGAPERDEPLLAQEFEHIDRDGWVADSGSVSCDWDDEPAELALDERYRAIPADRLLPSFLLGLAIAERRTSQAQRDRWLRSASSVVEQRVEAIVSGQHRGAYERARRLAVACGEAIALARDQASGAASVTATRERFPRHHAFRAELDRATRESPLLPSPPARKRR